MSGPFCRGNSTPVGTARRRRAAARTADQANGTQAGENTQCRARKSAGTAWNANLRSASRGSAKPALMTLRSADVSVAPSHNPGWCDRSPPPAEDPRRAAAVLGARLRRAERGRGRNRGCAADHSRRQGALPGAALAGRRRGARNRGGVPGVPSRETLPSVPDSDCRTSRGSAGRDLGGGGLRGEGMADSR